MWTKKKNAKTSKTLNQLSQQRVKQKVREKTSANPKKITSQNLIRKKETKLK